MIQRAGSLNDPVVWETMETVIGFLRFAGIKSLPHQFTDFTDCRRFFGQGRNGGGFVLRDYSMGFLGEEKVVR